MGLIAYFLIICKLGTGLFRPSIFFILFLGTKAYFWFMIYYYIQIRREVLIYNLVTGHVKGQISKERGRVRWFDNIDCHMFMSSCFVMLLKILSFPPPVQSA